MKHCPELENSSELGEDMECEWWCVYWRGWRRFGGGGEGRQWWWTDTWEPPRYQSTRNVRAEWWDLERSSSPLMWCDVWSGEVSQSLALRTPAEIQTRATDIQLVNRRETNSVITRGDQGKNQVLAKVGQKFLWLMRHDKPNLYIESSVSSKSDVLVFKMHWMLYLPFNL